MKKYAKIINENTKECVVGSGTNEAFYMSIGMEEKEVEEAYNGAWYIAGYAPEKPEEELIKEKKEARNRLLSEQDKYMLPDFPIDEEEREERKAYRKYLRDITKAEGFPNVDVLNFENWLANIK